MTRVPEWRKMARPGVLLAQAKAAAVSPPANSLGTAQNAPVLALQGRDKVNAEMEAVLRASARDRWRGGLISYYTPDIVEATLRSAMAGNLLAQWTMFDLMEQTWPRLAKNLLELKNAVLDLNWNVQPFALKGKKPTPEAQRRAQTAERLLWNMRPEPDADEADFEDTLFDSMDALGKGIAVQEVYWLAPGQDGNQTGLWMPRATKWAHPRYYGYQPNPGSEDRLMLNMMEVRLSNPDGDRALQEANARFMDFATGPAGLVSGAAPMAGGIGNLYAQFPRDQFIISIFKMKSGHPITGALLRLLGFWWAASNFSWEWFLNLAQIFGVPLRWATYATGTGQANTIQLVQEMMANLGSAGWAVFPEGTQLNVAKALESARDNPAKAFIDAADVIADTLILGQTLTTTQGERGSQSLGNIHKTVRDEKVQAVAKRDAKIQNAQFLPAICRMNFGDDQECPWLQPAAKESKNALDVAIRYKTILSIPGIEVSKQQFYEENDLVMPSDATDVILGQASGGNAAPSDGGKADDGSDETPSNAVGRGIARAKDATDKLTDNVLEDLTGVEAKWLAGVKPYFRRLVLAAQSKHVTDKEFIDVLQQARKDMPELFNKLNHTALANALEGAMGAAVVNGAARGAMDRPRGPQQRTEGTK